MTSLRLGMLLALCACAASSPTTPAVAPAIYERSGPPVRRHRPQPAEVERQKALQTVRDAIGLVDAMRARADERSAASAQ